ncbi:MAG: hypothetical protein EOM03_06715 [Clostridia bacterium]|nr:hypothetical protein [Clostridia bacterium]
MRTIASGRLWNRAGITGISAVLLLALMLALLAAVHPSTHEWIHHAASNSENHLACSHEAEAQSPSHSSDSDSSGHLPAKAECFVLWIAHGLLHNAPTFIALPQPIGFISLRAEPVYQLSTEAPEGLPFGRAPPSFNL